MLPVWGIMGLLLVLTMLLSDIMNNAATAVVMAPIGIALASAIGVSPDPMLMAVAVGASAAFLTPIGHQNNLLVMGPGGYRFGDYWRLGLPLEMLIAGMSLWLIPLAPEVQADIDRIQAIWRDCRQRFGQGGDFLFGQPTIADAFYAPVVTRFRSYEVALDDLAEAYCRAVIAWPLMQEWAAAAVEETEVVAFD